MRGANEYARALGPLFDETPKTVFAAIAVSLATVGGDYLDEAEERVLTEWSILHAAGIVPQRPPGHAGRLDALTEGDR